MEPVSKNKVVHIYQTKFFEPILEGLEVSPFMKIKTMDYMQETEARPVEIGDLTISDTLFCSYCNVGFVDKTQQRNHYKLDWHRYNLKQSLQQRKTVTEERFAQMAGEDDVSSISGSESESETETEQSSTDVDSKDDERLGHLITRRSRILFRCADGRVVSVHRSLLLNRKEEMPTNEHLIQMFKRMPWKNTWMIVMLGGGHFAAAIFKDGEAILHKTFHSYTVRAKQGGTQSSKDNKGGHPKSAGASLRRYNEQSLMQHVQDLVKAWGPDMVKCDLIFYRAVGRGNMNILFSGSNPPLLKCDPRVRGVPFTTRRPTFSELKRVYSLLTTIFVYDSDDKFRTSFSPTRKSKEKKKEEDEEPPKEKSLRKHDRAKERPSPVRELPSIVRMLAAEDSDSGSSYDLDCQDEEVDFSSLVEYEDTVPANVKEAVKRRPRKKKKKEPEQDPMPPEQVEFCKSIHDSCDIGNPDMLQQALESSSRLVSESDALAIINQKNNLGQTILHKVTSEGKGDLVRLLLLHGCDPCIKDKKSLTPYDVAPDKNTRTVYRRFMGEFQDRYDYSKSHIPSPLTDDIEQEVAEKKRLARQRKKQKEKEKKAANEAQRQEEEEKKRFLALSDREKRALAAERRMLSSAGQKNIVLARCFLCAEDMTGKVPFEYDAFRFCSMTCLKTHRIQNIKIA